MLIGAVCVIASCNGSGGKYTVTFDLGSGNGTIPAPQYVAAGGKVQLPEEEPTLKGCNFIGWYNGKTEWNFAEDVVTGDMVLTAKFSREQKECAHDYEVTEYIEPTCEVNGRRIEVCSICRKRVVYTPNTDETLKKKKHEELTEIKDPTCGVEGYTRLYCPNGCGLNKVTPIKATGKHTYDIAKWEAVVQPTLYAPGLAQLLCTECGGGAQTQPIEYNATQEDLKALGNTIGNYIYKGESFVNIATYGSVSVSSYYSSTKGFQINDGDITTYWTADTYADGCDYTKDWFVISFLDKFEISAIKLTMPNYYAWQLGEDCYVSYDIEYWDDATSSWVYLGAISDKTGEAAGMNATQFLELENAVVTNQIRARVTHATRYAPATIYEAEIMGKAPGVIRVPVSAAGEVTASISGKYNEWVPGAETLLDNVTGTVWTTDARFNPTPWAIIEFPKAKYVAAVQVATNLIKGRKMALEKWVIDESNAEGGYWEKIADLEVLDAGVVSGYIVGSTNGVCTFNVDINENILKLKLTITKEPQYWESKICDFIPYTIVEQASGLETSNACLHKYPSFKERIEPTCTTNGYDILSCACGVDLISNASDAKGHTFGDYEIVTEASATACGYKKASCACGVSLTTAYTLVQSDAVITPYLHNAPGAWALTFDDGNYLSTYDWVIPQLQKYGFKATVVMAITYSDALVANWQKYFATGAFDLGSHSYNHLAVYDGSVSASTLLHEVVDAQYWFRHNFRGQKVLAHASPFGQTSYPVAEYLTGPMAANRLGQSNIFYSLMKDIEGRQNIGTMNSYISNSQEDEGDYVFIPKDGKGSYKFVVEVIPGEPQYDEEGNIIIDPETGEPVMSESVTVEKYEWVKDGSYSSESLDSFVESNSGKYGLYRNPHGEYVFVEKSYANYVYSENAGIIINIKDSIESIISTLERYYKINLEEGGDINTVVDVEALQTEIGNLKKGTYNYIPEEYRFEYLEKGTFAQSGDGYTYKGDDSGAFKLVHSRKGFAESCIETLVANNALTVDCFHCVFPRGTVTNFLWVSYESTIAKFEYLTRKGVWTCSYNDMIQYIKEYQESTLTTLEYTDTAIRLSLTDTLDDYMFNHALTIKIDIPDDWSSVTVMQGENSIPMVDGATYKHSSQMSKISCSIIDGYLYVDAIPDCGEIVITKN